MTPGAEDGQWAPVPVALPLEGRMAAFEVDGQSLLLCNVGGQAHVIANRCPHGGVPLAPGVLRGRELECPFHGGKLDVCSGAATALPIRRPVRTFPVRIGTRGLEVRFGAG